MDKENKEKCDTCMQNEILLSNKKRKLLIFATWMDLEGITLSEISHTEKDKYYVMSLTCGI